MLFMIIERFVGGDARPVYRHLREQGRGVPAGVRLVESWVDVGLGRCFQLMETDDAALLQRWAAHWQGLVEFEVVAVVPGADTQRAARPARRRGGDLTRRRRSPARAPRPVRSARGRR